jgi:hypothetical protein
MASNTLWVFSKGFPVLFRRCWEGFQQPLSAFPRGVSINLCILYISLPAACFSLFKIKNGGSISTLSGTVSLDQICIDVVYSSSIGLGGDIRHWIKNYFKNSLKFYQTFKVCFNCLPTHFFFGRRIFFIISRLIISPCLSPMAAGRNSRCKRAIFVKCAGNESLYAALLDI